MPTPLSRAPLFVLTLGVALALCVPGASASSLSTAEQLAIAGIVLGSIAIIGLLIYLVFASCGCCGLYKHHHHTDTRVEYVDGKGNTYYAPAGQQDLTSTQQQPLTANPVHSKSVTLDMAHMI